MHFSQLLVLAGALGASAMPSHHAHREAHSKREQFVKGARPEEKAVETPVPTPVTYAAAAATTFSTHFATTLSTSISVAQPTSTTASSSTPKSTGFCNNYSSTKHKRVTAAQVAYTGNTGTGSGCKWGSNIIAIDESEKENYSYTMKLENVDSTTYQVLAGNKIGADGKNSGSFWVDGQDFLELSVGPGETKYIALDSNTQAWVAYAPGTIEKTENGQVAGMWVEVDLENTSNEGWSGGDCSSLVAQAYGLTVPGCWLDTEEGTGKPSIIWPGALRWINAFIKGMEEVDGEGLNLAAAATQRLAVKMGYNA